MSNTNQPDNAAEPMLYTYPEAARRLGIGERTLSDLVKAGEIRVVRAGRSVRFSPEALAEWIRWKEGRAA